jgi:DNA repair exonuclease SbcCD nuclease subunit
MTRLGSKLPFRQAAEELAAFCRTTVSEATVRRKTHENGQASEAVARQEAEEIEAKAPTASAQPEQVIISADGAFIALTNGEWREVKTVVVGEFTKQWNERKSTMEIKSDKLSYFSRTYPAREFERYALSELHRRGIERAGAKVTVNDGAAWIQSFIDYHYPKAVRIIDFAHAQSYVAKIGRTILGEGSAEFPGWFRVACHQLKHEPP